MGLVDAHCHLHEFNDDELLSYCGAADLSILAVADDLKSSLRTLEISSKCVNVIPSVGIHPWKVGNSSWRDVDTVLEVASKVRFLGEVGIDRRFVPQTYSKQLKVFKEFIEYASRNGLGVNVHAAGAWRDALKILLKYDVKVAIIHWYTGPLELLNDIHSVGYYVTINSAVKTQSKLREVALKATLDMILTESDGPYVYKGIRMSPEMVLETAKEISSLKDVELREVISTVFRNYRKVLEAVGLQGS